MPGEEDDPTLDGGFVVSRRQMGEVYNYVKGNHTRLTEMGIRFETIEQASRDTATASQRMAAIMEERAKMEAEAREAAREAARREAEERAKFWSKVVDFASSHGWKIVGLLLLIFYPQILRQAQDYGFIPAFRAAPPPIEQPAPAPVIDPEPVGPNNAP
jgi:hypothetical protein